MKRFSPSLLTFFLMFGFAITSPVVFMGCDSDSTEDGDGGGGGGGGPAPGPGEARVAISGAASGSFTGDAFFTTDFDDTGEGFAIVLFDGSVVTLSDFVVFGNLGDRPAPGEYDISLFNPGGFFAYYFGFTSAEVSIGLFAESGTLTITSSSSERVVGAFSFTGPATDGDGMEIGAVTVSGSFSAVFVEDGEVPTARGPSPTD